MTERRPQFVSLFRYPLRDHEALNNIYPRVLARLAETIDVHHFCYRDTVRHPLEDQPGFHLHPLGPGIRRQNARDKWLKSMLWYLWAFHIALWARRHKADLIYVEETLPVLPLILRYVSGRPVLISAADIFYDAYIRDDSPFRWVKSMLLATDIFTWKRLRGLVTRTQAFKDFAVSRGVDGARIRVVPEAAEDRFFHPMDRAAARRDAGYRDGQVVLLHHGVLHPNKALDRILRFIEPSLRANVTLHLVFAGDGPMRRTLETLAAELKISDRVTFTGWLPGTEDLNVHLNACDVSLVIREGRFSDHFHITANLLHSFACGCAILCSRLRGMSEHLQENRNGLLFDPADGAEFRAQLQRLIDDPALRRRLGEAARQTAVEKLSPHRVSDLWYDALLFFMTAQESSR